MTMRDVRARALAAAEFHAADYRRRDNWTRDESQARAIQRFLECYWRYGVQMDSQSARCIVLEAIRTKEIYA